MTLHLPTPAHRAAKVLVLFVLLLTVLLGMLGLVIDGGMMMAAHRHTQNAADSAALAAAMDLMRGSGSMTATASATTFVQTHNGLAGATVTVNIPPQSGPYKDDGQFVEVIVTRPYSTMFAQVLGANPAQQISARAVAGFEPVSSGEGAIVLDPNASTGLSFNGTNTRLKVKGTVVINSRTNGWNQYRQPVYPGTTPGNPYALTTSNSIISDPTQAFIRARAVQVAGGVDTPENIKDYDDPVNNPSPLYAGIPVGPDPLRMLAVPTQSNTPSITNWTPQGTVSVGNNQSVTLNPGIYADINITGGTVTFNPGVYVLSPTGNNQGLRISGGTVTARGVMFYFAGSNYLHTSPGYWDEKDGALDYPGGTASPLPSPDPPPPASPSLASDPYGASVTYATLNVGGSSGTVTLEGMPYNTNDAADKTLFFFRRRNRTAANFGGGGSGNMLTEVNGTIYHKWGQFTLSGGRTYDSQFIVGSLVLAGGAEMTINATGINRGRANQVFLVE